MQEGYIKRKPKVKDFKEYKLKYKEYVTELFADEDNIKGLNTIHKIYERNGLALVDRERNNLYCDWTRSDFIVKKTIHKYYTLFLHYLNVNLTEHNSKREFNTHFSNWLKYEKIKNVIPIQKLKRYV